MVRSYEQGQQKEKVRHTEHEAYRQEQGLEFAMRVQGGFQSRVLG